MAEKKKILLLSDDLRMTSGIATHPKNSLWVQWIDFIGFN